MGERRSWWCRLALHRWQRVTFRDLAWHWVWPAGRRCRLCGAVQGRDPYTNWIPTNATPNEDAHGYY